MFVETEEQKTELIEKAEWRMIQIQAMIDRNYGAKDINIVMRGLASKAWKSPEIQGLVNASDVYRPLFSGKVSAATAHDILFNPYFVAEPALDARQREQFLAVLWKFSMHVFESVEVAPPVEVAHPEQVVAPVVLAHEAIPVAPAAPALPKAPAKRRSARAVRAAQAAHSAANRAKAKELGRPGTRDVQAALASAAVTALPGIVQRCFQEFMRQPALSQFPPELLAEPAAIFARDLIRMSVQDALIEGGFDPRHARARVSDTIDRLLTS